MRLNHVIESQQFDREMLEELFSLADSFDKIKTSNLLTRKVMCTLFYEPSTRTRFSFESAMTRLGGKILSTEAAGMFSSAAKGESLSDTIRIVDDYCDVIVIRSSEDNAAEVASKLSEVPVINAGCGRGQHPTQSLLDVYTIKKELGRLDNVHVGIVGDLKYGRTVRSLAYLLGKYSGIKITFISPENLKIGEDIKEYLERHGVKYVETDNLQSALPLVDVLYMTRIQRERMDESDYIKAKGKFVITQKELNMMKPNARLLHPLPHIEEIQLPIEVEESDRRVAYFRQARNGLFIRMALLKMILGENMERA